VPQQKPPELTSDWDELLQARNGSQEAWRVLFDQHAPRLLRMAALIVGSTDAARDCVQETFVRVLRSTVHHQTGTLQAYLSTIAYRLALKESIRLRRLVPQGSPEAASPGPSPLEDAIAGERQREVARALQSLPPRHREILILRLHGEHSYEEIAEMTGLPLGTVKSRIFYAVRQIRTMMKKRGVE